jgi:hypothetical protein
LRSGGALSSTIVIAVVTAVCGAVTVSVATISNGSLTECKGLVGVAGIALGDVEDAAIDGEARALFVLGLERKGPGSAIECEELRIGNLATCAKAVSKERPGRS